MGFINVEIKARCSRPELVEQYLDGQDARYAGTDHQVDTYFRVKKGRLKLREGKIENALIYYERENESGPKVSNVLLYKTDPGSLLKEMLTTALGIHAVVDKSRKIYFIRNVKFHIDEVKGLGSFVEIEAIDTEGKSDKDALQQQCEFYLTALKINQQDLVSKSYSDLLNVK